MNEGTINAVNEEHTCKNCGQKIVLWTLPQMGYFPESPAWYHVCVDPQGLGHFSQHTANDPKLGEETCYKPQPR